MKYAIALALTGLTLLSGCTVGPAQTLDTHTGEWESAPIYDEPAGPPEPGWQCDGQPCTDEQLQDLVDALEPLE